MLLVLKSSHIANLILYQHEQHVSNNFLLQLVLVPDMPQCQLYLLFINVYKKDKLHLIFEPLQSAQLYLQDFLIALAFLKCFLK